MVALVDDQFKGMVPRTDPHALAPGYAQTATNAKLIRSILQAWNAPSTVQATTTGIKTIRRYPVSGTVNWLAWSTDVPSVTNIVAGDTKQHIVWAEGGVMRHSRNDKLVFTGNYVKDTTDYFTLGVPAPTDAPVVSVTGEKPDQTVVRTYVYAWVYRTTIGGMSEPISVEVGVDQSVSLESLNDTPPATVSGVAVPQNRFKKFIFLYDSDTNTYGLVKRLDWSATEWTDTKGKVIRNYKSTVFKPAKITAPTGPTITANQDGTGTTGWTLGTGWTHGASEFTHAGPSGGDLTYALSGLLVGLSYVVYFNTSGQTSGTFDLKLDATTIKSNIDQNNLHVATFTATGTSHNLVFSASATCDVSILDLKVTLGAPYAIAIDGTDAASISQRKYVYCWRYLSNGVYKRTDASAVGSVSGVHDGDSVLVSDMSATSGLPAGTKGVRKMIFRQDHKNPANYRLVGTCPAAQTWFIDTKIDKKLGAKITHWTIGTAGTPSAPTVTLNTNDATDITKETRYYVYTYVTAWGEESAPSPISLGVEVLPWESVTLTTGTTAPTGYANITLKRFYRSTSTTDFQLVFEEDVPIATASVDDDVETSDLGEIIPTTTWDVPPTGVTWLCSLPSNVVCIVFGNQVGFSDPGHPYAWPTANQFPLDYQTVACVTTANGTLVLTEGTPYLCQGSDPASMLPVRLELQQACIAATSVVDLGDIAIYASPDGLVAVSGMDASLITDEVITRDQWRSYVYESNGAVCRKLKAFLYERRYLLFWDNGVTQGGLLFDPADKSLVTFSLNPTAGFNDLLTDTLYLQIGSNIQSWDTGSALTYTYKSRRVLRDEAINPACAKVDASAYPVTFKLYADGVLKHTETVADARAFRLPGGYRAFAFEYELSGTADVRRVSIATSMSELK